MGYRYRIIAILVGLGGTTNLLAVPPQQIARADLAIAYHRFEKAFLEHRPEGQGLIDANLAFEDVTHDFFRMGFSSAIQKLNDKALELALQRPPTTQEKWLASLRLTLEPPIVVSGRNHPVAHLDSVYAVEGAKAEDVVLIASREGSTAKWGVTPMMDAMGSTSASVALTSQDGEWSGTWNFQVALKDGISWDAGRFLTAVPEDLDALRESLKARLAKVAAKPDLKSAMTTCASRIELLKMVPNQARSVEFSTDYNVLAPQVVAEVAEIEAGRNPYAGRKGGYWRIVQIGATRIPLRVYVPPSLDMNKPAPLIVVLHGAGGDENMFPDAYGMGAILREADKHGLVVASPATFYFASTSKYLEPMLRELSADYNFDAERIYVLGHSLGGEATALLARDCSDTIAAACCMAGVRELAGAPSLTPTLLVAAELDELVPADGVEQQANAGIAAGLPIEFRKIPNYGHTLFVEVELPRCVEWLLKHRKATPPSQ